MRQSKTAFIARELSVTQYHVNNDAGLKDCLCFRAAGSFDHFVTARTQVFADGEADDDVVIGQKNDSCADFRHRIKAAENVTQLQRFNNANGRRFRTHTRELRVGTISAGYQGLEGGIV